jgi:O-antigen ligase
VYSADIHRLAGLLGSPAFFATLITMCAGFAVYRFTQEPALNTRIVYLLLSVYMVAGVYVTYNRAGWLSLALNLVIMALFWPRFRRLFVAALLIGALGLALSWTTVQQSVVFRQRISASGPIEYRMEIWGRAASILSRSPITGLGYGNFGRVYLRYNPAWEKGTVLPAPHNSFLEVTFNTGLVGALPYIAMFAGIGLGILRSLRRARDQTAGEAALILAFGLAVLAYLVQAMVVDMVAAHYVNMTMMLAVGSVFGWQSEEKREHAGRHLGPVSTGFDAAGRG